MPRPLLLLTYVLAAAGQSDSGNPYPELYQRTVGYCRRMGLIGLEPVVTSAGTADLAACQRACTASPECVAVDNSKGLGCNMHLQAGSTGVGIGNGICWVKKSAVPAAPPFPPGAAPPPDGCQNWACEELDFPRRGWQRNEDCCAIAVDSSRCSNGLFHHIRTEQCIRGCANYVCCSYSSTPPPGVSVHTSTNGLPTRSNNDCPEEEERFTRVLRGMFILAVGGGFIAAALKAHQRRQQKLRELQAVRLQQQQQQQQRVFAAAQPHGSPPVVAGVAMAVPVQGYPQPAEGVPQQPAMAVPSQGGYPQATVVQAVAVPISATVAPA